MACPAPSRERRPRRRASRTRANRSASLLLLAALALIFGYALRKQPQASRPAPPAPGAQVSEQVLAALPAGASLIQGVPLPDGSMALAWHENQAAHTGVAFAQPGGGYRLWRATTDQKSDVAAHAEVSLIRLQGVSEPVMVSAYATEGCCAWVHLFALGAAPRPLFQSPTHFSRLLQSGILVERRLDGEYPDGPVASAESYTWSPGRGFQLSGARVAPQYYFPLARSMRWTYRSGATFVVRWVQEARQTGEATEYVVRSAEGAAPHFTGESEAVYVYTAADEVHQRAPVSRAILPASPGIHAAWGSATIEVARGPIRTPAGEFSDVLIVTDGPMRSYYAPNVGLIREERSGRLVLELTSYTGP